MRSTSVFQASRVPGKICHYCLLNTDYVCKVKNPLFLISPAISNPGRDKQALVMPNLESMEIPTATMMVMEQVTTLPPLKQTATMIQMTAAADHVRGCSASSDVSSDISPSPLYILPHHC